MLSVVMLNVVMLSVEAPTHLDAPKAAAQVKLPQTFQTSWYLFSCKINAAKVAKARPEVAS